MSDPVELLIQLQDLDLMIRELGNEKTANAEKKLGFELRGLDTLRDARESLAKQIDKELLRKYERILVRFPRAVVPMRDGICFGCFMRQAAQRSVADAGSAERVEFCEHCGRLLFRFRFP